MTILAVKVFDLNMRLFFAKIVTLDITVQLEQPERVVAVAAAGNAANVSWNNVPVPEGGGYEVYYKPSTESDYPACPASAVEEQAGKGCDLVYPVDFDPAASTQTTVTNLDSIEYDFLVRAFFDEHKSNPADCTDCEEHNVLIGSVLTPTTSIDITIKARPEKRDVSAGDNYGLDAMLLIYDPASEQITSTTTLTLDDTGVATLSGVEVQEGIHLEAYLKGRSHLARKISNVSISAGQNLELDFTEGEAGDFGLTRLSAGDVQGSWPGLKDNFVDILDVSAVDARFNQQDKADADLNKDTIVDILDMSTVLSNFNESGETLPEGEGL